MKKLILLLALVVGAIGAHASDSTTACGRIVYTGTYGNVTWPSGVQGTSMVYITLPASVEILNPFSNTVTAHYYFSNTTWSAAGATSTAMTLTPGARVVYDRFALRFLHIYYPTPGTQANGPRVGDCY